MPERVNQGGLPKPGAGKSIERKGAKRIIEWALAPLKRQTSVIVDTAISQGTSSTRSTTHEPLSPSLPDPPRPVPITDGKPNREPERPGSNPKDEPKESALKRFPAIEEPESANTGRGQREISKQQSEASSEKMSNSLWDEIFETLQMENPGLLSWFEMILSSKSRGTLLEPSQQGPGSGVDNSPISQGSSHTRRSNMENILNIWLAEGAAPKQEDSIAGNDVATSKLRTSLRNILRDSIESTPAGAIPVWVAACYAAEKLFLHPTEATERDCEGVLYVILRVKWYCCLSNMVLGEVTDGGDNRQQHQPKLREAIVSLYHAVFSYLVATVCANCSDLDFDISIDARITAFRIRRRGINAVTAAERALSLFDGVRVENRLEAVLSSARKILKSQTSQPQPVDSDERDEKFSSTKFQEENLLEKLDITDPRHNIPQLQTCDKQDPSQRFYHALLSTTQYESFRDWSKAGNTNRLLCISGGPGQGKTILLTTVVQALLADKANTESQDHRQLSFFFFNHNTPHANHPAVALRSLIWLILEAQPKLVRHLTDQFASTNRDTFHHPRDFPALSAVFYKMVEDDELKETYLVVDALDQCFPNTADSNQPGIEEFLFLITQSLVMSDKIRWLVSFDSDSDSEATLRKALIKGTGEKKSSLHIDLESSLLCSHSNQTGYIEASVKELANEKRYDDELENSIIERLCKQPFRNYLWVDTVCAALRADEVWHALDVINDVKNHTSLSDLYEYVHDNLKCLPRGDGRLCIQAISTMALLHEPIQVDELEYLMKLGKWVDVRNILRKCSAFLRDTGDKIWFLHPFAKKYIRKQVIDHSTASSGHSKLALECLDYLGSILSSGPGTKSVTASYSLLHWITHLGQIPNPSQDTDVQEKFHWFLANHFLQWIEQLILCGQLSAAAAKLQKVDIRLHIASGATPQDRMKKNESLRATLQVMIRDALLFIYLHQSTHTPPDVPAHNTLAFCPETSFIRRLLIGQMLPGLSSTLPMHPYWGQDSRILQGHTDWTRCVAFSPDGRLLASGSDDETVRIWDVDTGETQHQLAAQGGWIYSIAFSSQREASKSGVVAAGSEGLVTLWDANTGRLLNKLKHSGSINSLAFSADARWLAVASSFAVQILDIKGLDDNTKLTDTSVKLPCKEIHHNETVRSVAFSPNGRLLATGADDAKIRVWSVESICNERRSEETTDQVGRGTMRIQELETEIQGSVSSATAQVNRNSESATELKEPNAPNPLHIFEGHTGPINSVVFSANSEVIASCSDDGTNRIWLLGPEKFGALHTLGDNGRPSVNSVSFLPNKATAFVASCNGDCIDLWDVESEQKVGSVTSHSSRSIFSLAFSPDGAFIATGSTDSAVHIWYAATWVSESDTNFENKSRVKGSVDEMAISPDGCTVATSHPGGRVKLWDVKTSKVIKDVDTGHTRILYSMTFSPGGGMLLTSSSDMTAAVCKVPSGDPLHRFTGHDDWVRFAAWSHDEMYIASASDDGTVRIWKIGGNNEEVAKLTHSEENYATGVAFSPNGEYLVTCGEDKRVLVWQRGAQDADKNYPFDWRRTQTIEVDTIPRYLAVTLDSQRVVSYAAEMLRFFVIETGKESEEYPAIKIEGPSTRTVAIWFDARFEEYVMTTHGARSLKAYSSTQVPVKYPYGIMTGEKGLHITRGGKKFIFLPDTCGITASLVVDDYVVLGMRDGGIQVLSFAKSPRSHVLNGTAVEDT